MTKDLKYLSAYLVPCLAFFSVYMAGWWSFTAFVFVFMAVPAIEPFMANSPANLEEPEISRRSGQFFFDVLLYINIPIVYGLLTYFLWKVHAGEYALYELTGMITAVGLTLSSAGINVAHELGHRPQGFNKWCAILLLLPSQYCHFIIEHNLGHHKTVGTDADAASARKNEILYLFWLRSVAGGYINAWSINQRLLARNEISFLSLRNKMLVYTFFQVMFLLIIFWIGSWYLLTVYLATSIFSILMLETINYIEHYGLRRKILENGRYERVQPWHSWNSNHELGRILLYELTRHSDHHYLASKKYQLLDHHDEAKQLPVGYPASMLMSMVPPVWFAVMNKRI